RQPGRAPLEVIDECLSAHELGDDRNSVESLVIDELRRLHEGVLARYGLRPSEFVEWQSRQRAT
ncbi:MAG: Fic family protein, partial [Betaproteobacteria bacterium]